MEIDAIVKFIFRKLNYKVKRLIYFAYSYTRSLLFFYNKRIEIKAHFEKEHKFKKTNLNVESLYIWETTFLKLWWTKPEVAADRTSHFCNDTIECCKTKHIDYSDIYPILICVVKNDLPCIKIMIEHYKKIGIKNFIFIDNMSDDGTYEWLLNEDVNLYRTSETFNSINKSTWISRIVAIYGLNRWYIVVDSDEMLSYPSMEKNDILVLIKWAERQNIKRVLSFMLDMYSKKSFNEMDKGIDIDIKSSYCYFDHDNYKLENTYVARKITGGPRKRLMQIAHDKGDIFLTKYPLIYWQEGEIFSAHFGLMSYNENFKSPCVSALLHYKFLPGFMKRYKSIIDEKLYHNGGSVYKGCLDGIQKGEINSFYNEKSVKYNSSEDLLKIPIIVNFNDYI